MTASRPTARHFNSLLMLDTDGTKRERHPRSSSPSSVIGTVAEATDCDAAASANDENALPPSYARALDRLLDGETSDPPLTALPDSDVLVLAKELITAICDAKDAWAEADRWADEEAALYRIAGTASDVSIASSRMGVGAAALDYVRTYAEALEYKLGKEGGGEGKAEPELLSKRRPAPGGGDGVVYGPVNFALLPGNSFEVWTSPSSQPPPSDAEVVEDSEAPNRVGKIGVVLGAGNQSLLTIVDVLDNVLRGRRAVLLKHHPLRPWLAGPYGIMLEPLARRGYFAQVLDVGVDVTKVLLSHAAVDHVHVTGSFRTAEAVRGILQEANPTFSPQKIRSMVTSELGCATPHVLDDGAYTESELQHAARIIACAKKVNAGSNCLAAQVVVVPKGWEHKELFRAKLTEELKRQPTTPCYYPGSVERKRALVEQCEGVGSTCTAVVAPSVSEDTRVCDDDQVVVVECGTPGEEGYNPRPLLLEAFGPVLAIVELDDRGREGGDGDGDDDDDDGYLANTVVPFLNDKENIYGSLSCTIHTPTSKGSFKREGLQAALAALRYGCVAINQWSLLGYSAAARGGVWGGHPLEALGQSGDGCVGDQYGIVGDDVGKVVVYGPPLEAKPIIPLDNASPPPVIVLDVFRAVICSDGVAKGVARALALVVARLVRGAMSYVPLVGRFFL